MREVPSGESYADVSPKLCYSPKSDRRQINSDSLPVCVGNICHSVRPNTTLMASALLRAVSGIRSPSVLQRVQWRFCHGQAEDKKVLFSGTIEVKLAAARCFCRHSLLQPRIRCTSCIMVQLVSQPQSKASCLIYTGALLCSVLETCSTTFWQLQRSPSQVSR